MQTYAWKDITVVLQGNIILELKSVKYKKTKATQVNHGTGDEPVSYSTGNKAYELQIQMTMKEVIALREALPAGSDETDLKPFDVTIVYTNPDNIIVEDVIHGVQFSEAVGGGDQGNMELVHDMPCVCSGITFHKR